MGFELPRHQGIRRPGRGVRLPGGALHPRRAGAGRADGAATAAYHAHRTRLGLALRGDPCRHLHHRDLRCDADIGVQRRTHHGAHRGGHPAAGARRNPRVVLPARGGGGAGLCATHPVGWLRRARRRGRLDRPGRGGARTSHHRDGATSGHRRSGGGDPDPAVHRIGADRGTGGAARSVRCGAGHVAAPVGPDRVSRHRLHGVRIRAAGLGGTPEHAGPGGSDARHRARMGGHDRGRYRESLTPIGLLGAAMVLVGTQWGRAVETRPAARAPAPPPASVGARAPTLSRGGRWRSCR